MSSQISKGQIALLICVLTLAMIGSKLFGLIGGVLGGALGGVIGYGLVKLFKWRS